MAALQPKGLAPRRKRDIWNKRSNLLCLTQRETLRRWRLKKIVYTNVASIAQQVSPSLLGKTLVAAPLRCASTRPPKSGS